VCVCVPVRNTPRPTDVCVFAYVKIAERLRVQISGDGQKSMQIVTFNPTHDPYCSVPSFIHTRAHSGWKRVCVCVMGRFRGQVSVWGHNIQFVQYKNHYVYKKSP